MVSRRGFLSTLLAPAVVASAGGTTAPSQLASPSSSIPPWPDESAPDFWQRVRDQFYIMPGEAFFNTGTLGATPRPVLERVIEDMRTVQATITRWDYSPNTPDLIGGYGPQLPTREKLGRLVHAEARDLALTQNATFGTSFVAHGLDLRAGEEVILTDREHPGAISAWQAQAKRDGIVVKQIAIPIPANDPDRLVQLFADAITPRTRVLAFPHIISSCAVVLPAKRLTQLAHDHQCLSVIDGAQAIGQVKIDLLDIECDAYFGSPHKWLLAPAGNGFFYLRRDQQSKVWTTLCSFAWDDHDDGMFRFMRYGTGNPSVLTGLDAALDFHFRLGPERVRQRMRFLLGVFQTATPSNPSGMNTYYKDFSPRVGLAYSLNDKTVIRAAYGIFYAQGNGNRVDGTATVQGYNGTVGSTSPDSGITPGFILGKDTLPGFTPDLSPTAFLGGGTPRHSAGTLIAIDSTDGLSPYNQNYTLDIERQLPSNTVLTVAFVGNKGTHLASRLTPWDKMPPQYLPLGNTLVCGDVVCPANPDPSLNPTPLLFVPIGNPQAQAAAPIAAMPIDRDGHHSPFVGFENCIPGVGFEGFVPAPRLVRRCASTRNTQACTAIMKAWGCRIMTRTRSSWISGSRTA